MEAQVNMLHLFVQQKLQPKLQASLKTYNTQNYQKIELYGSLTTKDLKKSHSSRWVGVPEMLRGVERWQNRWSHIHMWWIKIRRDTLEAKDPSPRSDHTAPDQTTQPRVPAPGR